MQPAHIGVLLHLKVNEGPLSHRSSSYAKVTAQEMLG